MRKIDLLAVSFVLATALFSCNSSTKEEENKKAVDSSNTVVENKQALDSANIDAQVDAMFVEYSLGDASHYTFKDRDGKIWDFGRNEDSSYKFAVELPNAKSNETNQGWSSNKALQGKWFHVSYVYRTEPQYEGGPMAQVPVITHVAPNDPK